MSSSSAMYCYNTPQPQAPWTSCNTAELALLLVSIFGGLLIVCLTCILCWVIPKYTKLRTFVNGELKRLIENRASVDPPV